MTRGWRARRRRYSRYSRVKASFTVVDSAASPLPRVRKRSCRVSLSQHRPGRRLGQHLQLGERDVRSLLPLGRRLSQPRRFVLGESPPQLCGFQSLGGGANLLASLLRVPHSPLPCLELRSLGGDGPGAFLLGLAAERVVARPEPRHLLLRGFDPLVAKLDAKALEVLLRRLGLVGRGLGLRKLAPGLVEIALDRRIDALMSEPSVRPIGTRFAVWAKVVPASRGQRGIDAKIALDEGTRG